jgi:hypothetical protein
VFPLCPEFDGGANIRQGKGEIFSLCSGSTMYHSWSMRPPAPQASLGGGLLDMDLRRAIPP